MTMTNKPDEPPDALEQSRFDDSRPNPFAQKEHSAPMKDKTEYQKRLEESKEIKGYKEKYEHLVKEFEELKKRTENEKKEDYKDKHLRLLAEFDNVKKRTEREKAEFVKFANEELIEQFLGILDDLERSVEAAKTKHEDYDAFLKGIELVMARVYELLRKNQVRPIEAVGKKFDPHFHEPLMQEETDKAPEDTIVEVFQKGYTINGRVLRTAKVKVAKHKEQKSEN